MSQTPGWVTMVLMRVDPALWKCIEMQLGLGGGVRGLKRAATPRCRSAAQAKVRWMHGSLSVAAPQSTVTMPALSPTMTEGNLAEWKKKEGDKISPGDILAEVETDKATVAFEATDPGFLAKILIPNGSQKVQVGAPIAVIVDTAAEIATATAPVASAAPSAAAAAAAPTPAPSKPAATAAAGKPKPSVPFSVLAMPALSPTMSEGTIVSWKKNVGDTIKAGDALAEIETDKATVAFEATDDGVLAKILIPAGNNKVTVNTPVAIVVENAAHISQVADYDPSAEATGSGASAASASVSSAPASSTASTSAPAATRDASGRTLASPYAKRLAKESGVDLTQVVGSGPNNRIVAADVRQYSAKPASATAAPAAAATAAAAQPAAPKVASVGAAPSFTDIPVSNIRRVIAQRLTHSKQTIPHYYLTMECNVDKLMAVREQLNSASDGSYKLSVNDFIIKASALALKKVPEVNSEWRETVVRRYHNVDINVAVSAPQGLFTPLVRDADKKGLATLNSDVKELAEKAKAGKISPDDLSPGTFTISNLGMFGVSNFAAVINPPQACILAVGTTEKRVVPNPLFKSGDADSKQSAYTTANIISVTLSCDHRVVDGAVGAQWLQAFKSYLEDPLKLLL
eukprot:TRINITY_DN2294_c0_g2_i1.p1 TRINITY_DN2294_c0_g2~~TRINITY_DN2294_c0_g2_i1.p1  ORF type:complete len:630 (+),score=177.63 TRINITY_DN2294_c0_g2_i1:67-1956(+)